MRTDQGYDGSWVEVQWESGVTALYRYGSMGIHEVVSVHQSICESDSISAPSATHENANMFSIATSLETRAKLEMWRDSLAHSVVDIPLKLCAGDVVCRGMHYVNVCCHPLSNSILLIAESGPAWKCMNQESTRGTVVNSSLSMGWVEVNWGNGTSALYRYGSMGVHELSPVKTTANESLQKDISAVQSKPSDKSASKAEVTERGPPSEVEEVVSPADIKEPLICVGDDVVRGEAILIPIHTRGTKLLYLYFQVQIGSGSIKTEGLAIEVVCWRCLWVQTTNG